MSGPLFLPRRFGRDDSGAAMVEFGLVAAVFFLLFYTALDFGRLSYSRVLANHAVEIATRIAIVRPAACGGVPETNVRGPVPNNTIPPRFGTACNAAANVCAAVATITCAGTLTNGTANEIWTRIAPMLPPDATPANLDFIYTYDNDIGFLGGPYTPIVTVELNPPNFQFISPIGPLLTLVTGSNTLPSSVSYGQLSVSMPAEDLNHGEAG